VSLKGWKHAMVKGAFGGGFSIGAGEGPGGSRQLNYRIGVDVIPGGGSARINGGLGLLAFPCAWLLRQRAAVRGYTRLNA
jgi:hypothetical protein